jgi:hypothetical protein
MIDRALSLTGYLGSEVTYELSLDATLGSAALVLRNQTSSDLAVRGTVTQGAHTLFTIPPNVIVSAFSTRTIPMYQVTLQPLDHVIVMLRFASNGDALAKIVGSRRDLLSLSIVGDPNVVMKSSTDRTQPRGGTPSAQQDVSALQGGPQTIFSVDTSPGISSKHTDRAVTGVRGLSGPQPITNQARTMPARPGAMQPIFSTDTPGGGFSTTYAKLTPEERAAHAIVQRDFTPAAARTALFVYTYRVLGGEGATAGTTLTKDTPLTQFCGVLTTGERVMFHGYDVTADAYQQWTPNACSSRDTVLQYLGRTCPTCGQGHR